jgi:hypothetical protein
MDSGLGLICYYYTLPYIVAELSYNVHAIAHFSKVIFSIYCSTALDMLQIMIATNLPSSNFIAYCSTTSHVCSAQVDYNQ